VFGRPGVRRSGRPPVHRNPVPAKVTGASRTRLKNHEGQRRFCAVWRVEPDSGCCPNSLCPRVCQAIAEVKAHNLSPFGRASPHAPGLPFPPAAAAFLAAFSCGAARRYADPRSASLRSGDGRPRFGHGPAADAAGRGLRRGRLSSPLTRLRVELARGALARLRLGRCPRRPRGPVPCGQSGPREDRRGSSRRSAALFGPAGFGWGRARILLSYDCCLILLTVGGFKRWRIHIVTTEEEPCYGFVPRCVLMTLPVYEKM
jgi:hypothetical protein